MPIGKMRFKAKISRTFCENVPLGVRIVIGQELQRNAANLIHLRTKKNNCTKKPAL
jgi:hypothetical protein